MAQTHGSGNLQVLLGRLWEDYSNLNPQAGRIHALLEARGETLRNDHVAFRTFAHPGIDIAAMAKPFLAEGYRAAGDYEFPEKKLTAVHYEHPDPSLPKIFISQLHMEKLSQGARSMLLGLLNQVPPDFTFHPHWICAGRPWNAGFATFEALERESEYAAWMSAHGFRVNHFTVLANSLHSFPTLGALNAFLQAQGFRLNAMGGEIKGSPAEYLEQSSTLASEVEVAFTDGRRKVPGCYYEFARRYPLPDGRLFQGFNAKSADKIFQSTDRSAR
jgi:Domain of unknown function (DUF1338)